MIKETEYKNHFKLHVLNNDVLINKFNKIFKNMKNPENLVVSTQNYNGYVYEDKDNKAAYLVLDQKDRTTIYRDDRDYGNKSFDKFIAGDLDDLKYNYNKIISIFNSKSILKKYEKKIEDTLSVYPEESREYMKENFVKLMNIPEQMVSANPYDIKMFLTFLENNELAIPFDKDFLYTNPNLYTHVQKRVPELGVVLESIKEGLKEHNFTEKNKFQYNDADNYIWKNAQYIVSKEQNFVWVTDIQDQNNFTIYASIHPSNGNGSKAHSMTALLQKIKSKEDIDEIDYVALKVKDTRVEYANNAFMYSLDFNIMLNKQVLEEEEKIKVNYGNTDLKSFEYQLAYSNTVYGHSRVKFLRKALLDFGQGFSYDREQGRLYQDVDYIPTLLNEFEYKENKEDKKPLEPLVLFAPQKLEYLNDEWLESLKYMVNKIKTDNTDLGESHSMSERTPQQNLKDLEKTIKFNENFRKKKLRI